MCHGEVITENLTSVITLAAVFGTINSKADSNKAGLVQRDNGLAANGHLPISWRGPITATLGLSCFRALYIAEADKLIPLVISGVTRNRFLSPGGPQCDADLTDYSDLARREARGEAIRAGIETEAFDQSPDQGIHSVPGARRKSNDTRISWQLRRNAHIRFLVDFVLDPDDPGPSWCL